MDESLKVIIGAMIACDSIWRIVRIVNGEPLTTALRTTTRNEFIVWLVFMSVFFGWLAFTGDVTARIMCAIFSAGSTVTLVLELIYGGKDEQPAWPPGPDPDATSDSN
ncbi:MAG: hypothetical protein ACM3U2_02505 [Deltaproteobacteria bacterium]